jgi:hypothetical protein
MYNKICLVIFFSKNRIFDNKWHIKKCNKINYKKGIWIKILLISKLKYHKSQIYIIIYLWSNWYLELYMRVTKWILNCYKTKKKSMHHACSGRELEIRHVPLLIVAKMRLTIKKYQNSKTTLTEKIVCRGCRFFLVNKINRNVKICLKISLYSLDWVSNSVPALWTEFQTRSQLPGPSLKLGPNFFLCLCIILKIKQNSQ